MEQLPLRTQTSVGGGLRFGLVVACVFVVFVYNARFVLTEFTHGIGLLDAGWFSWIMASGDPWLTDPRAVDAGLSYFNYHLTPYLSALGIVVHALGVDRILAFAIHQGIVFALLAAGLCALVLNTPRDLKSGALLAAVMVMVLLGDVTWQIASFPHPEPLILSFCLLACAVWINGRRNWGALFFGLACFVREDGGLYAGAFLFALAVLRPVSRQTLTTREALLAAAAIVVALLMFLIKAEFFPGFSAFAFNFSGNNWSHLTFENLQARSLRFLTNPLALGAIVPAVLLGVVVSWRYFVFPVLMAPIILAQLLAAREYLWQFKIYYALPLLAVWSGLVVVATYRAVHTRLRVIEAAVLLASAILCSAPVLDAALPSSTRTMKQAFTSPVADLTVLSAKATEMARDNGPGLCVSTAVAALAPNSFTPEQVLDPDFNVQRCRTVILYNVDPHYVPLIWHLVYWNRRPPVLGRFLRYDNPGVPTS